MIAVTHYAHTRGSSVPAELTFTARTARTALAMAFEHIHGERVPASATFEQTGDKVQFVYFDWRNREVRFTGFVR